MGEPERHPTSGPAVRAVAAGREDEAEGRAPLFVVPDGPMRWSLRVRDVVLGTFGLVLTAPLLLALIVAVRLDSPGSALFSHRRLGRFGRPFPCFKLRTMVAGADELLDALLVEDAHLARQFAASFKLDPDPRVTRLGRWLRRSSLDELPQLLNVVRGDMSLVGPRPMVAAERARYGSSLSTVLSARPGMTGLWQVSGRSSTTYDERVELDVEYVRTRTFASDLKIILRTVVQVFRRENGAA